METYTLDESCSNSAYYNNVVEVNGYIYSEPTFHHKTQDENIYSFTIRIPRLNKNVSDYLIVEFAEHTVYDIKSLTIGKYINITGQFRSYNSHTNLPTGKKSVLQLFIFAKTISDFTGKESELKNSIKLRGNICKEPIYRVTPSNREISDIILAVNRVYNKSDYLPCIAWGVKARYASTLPIGAFIEVEGRIQSRDYIKKHEDGTEDKHTVYEVSLYKITDLSSNNTKAK